MCVRVREREKKEREREKERERNRERAWRSLMSHSLGGIVLFFLFSIHLPHYPHSFTIQPPTFLLSPCLRSDLPACDQRGNGGRGRAASVAGPAPHHAIHPPGSFPPCPQGARGLLEDLQHSLHRRSGEERGERGGEKGEEERGEERERRRRRIFIFFICSSPCVLYIISFCAFLFLGLAGGRLPRYPG